jgi:tetratricopeptide (TPR) repeat protein
VRITQNTGSPTAGEGLELAYNPTLHRADIAAYDRTGAAYKEIRIAGSTITIGLTSGQVLGFHGSTGSSQQTVTGSRGGNAALASGDTAGALGLLVEAESEARTAGSAPLQALAAIDRARALVALGRGEEALAALETATSLAPESAEGWLLKATLLRRLERLEPAQTAIETAARLAPTNPDIGLEAGVIAVLGGRDAAARQSWQSVIDLQPESLAAGAAKSYLEQLGPAAPVTQEEPPA